MSADGGSPAKKLAPVVPPRMKRQASNDVLLTSPSHSPPIPKRSPLESSEPKGEGSGGTNSTDGEGGGSTTREEFLGQFQLGQIIGKGGFGTVHKGLNLNTGEIVAIKRFSSQKITKANLAQVMGEAELLTKLDSERIVKFYGYVKTKLYLYFVLEYVEEGALTGVMSSFGVFSEKLAAIYVEQVLQGLAYLHSQHVIHRDIKGSNILLTKGGAVKLADFGVSAIINESEKRYSVVGTPYWMAPEVIEMSGHSVMSDIWSVACLVVELLTGEPPYFSCPPMAAMFRIVSEDHPDLPPKISSEAQDFLLQCWQKDASKRPSAEALLNHPWIKMAKAQTSGAISTRGSTTTPTGSPAPAPDTPKKSTIHESTNSIRIATIHANEEDISADDDDRLVTDSISIRSASIDSRADGTLSSTDSICVRSPTIDVRRETLRLLEEDDDDEDLGEGSLTPDQISSIRVTSLRSKDKAATLGGSNSPPIEKLPLKTGGSERRPTPSNTLQIQASGGSGSAPDGIQSKLWKKLETTLLLKLKLERELESLRAEAEELRAEKDDLGIKMIEMKNKNEEIMTLAKACLDYKTSHEHHDSSQEKQHEKLRKRLSMLLKESEAKSLKQRPRKKPNMPTTYLAETFQFLQGNISNDKKSRTIGTSLTARMQAEESRSPTKRPSRSQPDSTLSVTVNPLLHVKSPNPKGGL